MNAFNPPPAKPQLVVNLFGGPCAGKSSLAAIRFGRLKGGASRGRVAAEFAKDLAMENRRDALKCQIYVLGNQHWRIQLAFFGCAQIVATDSSCLLLRLPEQPEDRGRGARGPLRLPFAQYFRRMLDPSRHPVLPGQHRNRRAACGVDGTASCEKDGAGRG